MVTHRLHRRRIALLAASILASATGLGWSGEGRAQATAQSHTQGIRYDLARRVVGTISPDPDGTGALVSLAVRNTYDAAGNLVKVESGTLAAWQSEAIAPANWSGFTIDKTSEFAYDIAGRKLREWTYGATGGIVSLVQYSHDAAGRVECTAVRMNPATYGDLPASACTLAATGTFGPDRITRLTYDRAGRVVKKTLGFGTADQTDDEVRSYTPGGKLKTITDGEFNTTTYEYDGYGRLIRTRFPVATRGALASSTTDYEEYGYDATNNRTSLRKRDGSVFTYQYDALNRMTVKVVPERAGLAATHTRDVYYGYDLQGRQLYARFDGPNGEGVTMGYDGLGRAVSETKVQDSAWVLGSGYDQNGNRIGFTFADGQSVWRSFDQLGRPMAIWRSGVIMITDWYNNNGTQFSKNYGGPIRRIYRYDDVGRAKDMRYSLPVGSPMTVWNNQYLVERNPAGQVTARTQTNDNYAWTGQYNVDRGYSANGLNQYVAAGGASFTYDANGNLTSDGSTTFTYDAENRLVAASGAKNAQLTYDPLGRLHSASGASGTTWFVWDGNALAMEYGAGGAILRRYVHGADAGADDPLVWFEGAAMDSTNQRWLFADDRGSIVAVTTASAMLGINRYDEYGIPQSSNVGRFQYTGQAWLPELGMYYYKARIYSPTLGRFMQTDPIGYEDGVNWYAYVGNDPVNGVDPTGLQLVSKGCASEEQGKVSSSCAGSQGHISTDGSAGKSKTILERGQVESNELKDRIVTSAQLGLYGEDFVTERLEEEGYEIVARGIYLITRKGIRIADILVRKDGNFTLVEVKVNGGRYSLPQKEKDALIASEGAVVNPNSEAAKKIRFTDIRIPLIGPTDTKIVRVQCEYLGWRCRSQ